MADPLRRIASLAASLAALACLGGCGGSDDSVIFEADFGGPRRLLTNEYALHHPASPDAARSSQWFVTSGSLFVHAGIATNGPLDDVAPDARSSNGTNSAIFRVYTKRRFEPSYQVHFDVRVGPPREIRGLKPAPWDGLHLMLNAESPEAAYYVSLYRRNGEAVIKKKTPGGSIAGGSYEPISRYVPCPLEPDRWSRIRVDVRRAGERSVTIDLYENGRLLTTATDDRLVSGSAPFTDGRLGIRADKTSFAIRELVVRDI